MIEGISGKVTFVHIRINYRRDYPNAIELDAYASNRLVGAIGHRLSQDYNVEITDGSGIGSFCFKKIRRGKNILSVLIEVGFAAFLIELSEIEEW